MKVIRKNQDSYEIITNQQQRHLFENLLSNIEILLHKTVYMDFEWGTSIQVLLLTDYLKYINRWIKLPKRFYFRNTSTNSQLRQIPYSLNYTN